MLATFVRAANHHSARVVWCVQQCQLHLSTTSAQTLLYQLNQTYGQAISSVARLPSKNDTSTFGNTYKLKFTALTVSLAARTLIHGNTLGRRLLAHTELGRWLWHNSKLQSCPMQADVL